MEYAGKGFRPGEGEMEIFGGDLEVSRLRVVTLGLGGGTGATRDMPQCGQEFGFEDS